MSHILLRRGAWRSVPPKRRQSSVLMPRGLMRQSPFTGRGLIAGQGSGIVTVAGVPAVRRIFLFDCATLWCIRSTWSRADGTYLIKHLDPSREYLLLARDHKGGYEPVAYDYVRPFLPD